MGGRIKWLTSWQRFAYDRSMMIRIYLARAALREWRDHRWNRRHGYA
jgi:hypothetical protein